MVLGERGPIRDKALTDAATLNLEQPRSTAMGTTAQYGRKDYGSSKTAECRSQKRLMTRECDSGGQGWIDDP